MSVLQCDSIALATAGAEAGALPIVFIFGVGPVARIISLLPFSVTASNAPHLHSLAVVCVYGSWGIQYRGQGQF